jgi:hypothetical protein
MQNSREKRFLANETMKKIGFILLFCILQFHWIYSFRSIGYPTYTSLGRRSSTLFLWKKNDKNKAKDTPKAAPQRNTEKEIKKETTEKALSLPIAKKEAVEKATTPANPEKEARKEALTGVLTQIERSYGKGTIQKLGESTSMNVETTPSGSLTLDLALGGGYPRGRVIEIYGPESAGKTTLALHAVAEIQKRGGTAAFIDAEHALDPEYAKHLGVNIDELYICQVVLSHLLFFLSLLSLLNIPFLFRAA